MRPFASTISLEEARRRLAAAVRPIARTERVRLDAADGRVAAADVFSPIDVPPFARSAMDGYAVIAADTVGATRETPARLRQLDRIFTGALSSIAIESRWKLALSRSSVSAKAPDAGPPDTAAPSSRS